MVQKYWGGGGLVKKINPGCGMWGGRSENLGYMCISRIRGGGGGSRAKIGGWVDGNTSGGIQLRKINPRRGELK